MRLMDILKKNKKTDDGISRELSEDNLDKMIEMEKNVYPSYLWEWQSRMSWDSIASYLECSKDDIIFMMGEDWYMLAAKCKADDEFPSDHIYVADLASLNRGSANVIKVAHELKSFDLPITLYAREETTYRLIKGLARRELITILDEDEGIHFTEETTHSVTFVQGHHPELIEQLSGRSF